jgi:hypothetical protein
MRRSLFIYPLIAIFFLSLKEMGNMMADPFGTVLPKLYTLSSKP